MSIRTAAFVKRVCATSLALAACGGPVSANPGDGEKLARRWCAACHMVAPDQQRAGTDAPPFAAIARTPGFSREKSPAHRTEGRPTTPGAVGVRPSADRI